MLRLVNMNACYYTRLDEETPKTYLELREILLQKILVAMLLGN